MSCSVSACVSHTNTLTFVVVLVVAAVLLQRHRTIGTVPAVVAPALPQAFAADATLAVRRAAGRAALHRAVFAIPAGDAQTGAVLALAVLVAARIAQFRIAVVAAPAVVAGARFADAASVAAAVEIAQFCVARTRNM